MPKNREVMLKTKITQTSKQIETLTAKMQEIQEEINEKKKLLAKCEKIYADLNKVFDEIDGIQ